MAPVQPKTRDNQFFNVGVQGRKTGITLKDTGIRDEHGMEPIDGIFSSPEKSPLKRNNAHQLQQDQQQQDGTLTSSEMDIQQSSMPEPADALSAGLASAVRPPIDQSLVRTTIDSSQQPSLSVKLPLAVHAGSRKSTTIPPGSMITRRLDFSAARQISLQAGRNGNRQREDSPLGVYEIPQSPVHEQCFMGEADETGSNDSEHHISRMDERCLALVGNSESLTLPPEESEPGTYEVREECGEIRDLVPRALAPPPTGDGLEKACLDNKRSRVSPPRSQKRPPRSMRLVGTNQSIRAASTTASGSLKHVSQDDAEDSSMNIDRSATRDVEESGMLSEQESDQHSQHQQQLVTKPRVIKGFRGRLRPKHSVDADQTFIQLPEQPTRKAKPLRTAKKAQRSPQGSVTGSMSRGTMAKGQTKKRQKQGAIFPASPPSLRSSQIAQPEPNRTHPTSQVHGLQVLHQGKPFDDAGASTTRFGRISTKPVEYWRNERIEYAHDGTKKEIVRAKDVERQQRVANRRQIRRRTGKPPQHAMDEAIVMPDEWEGTHGVLRGPIIHVKDAQVQYKGRNIINAEMQDADIAFSADYIRSSREESNGFQMTMIVKSSNFRSGKIFIAPKRRKELKNSKSYYIVFSVEYGKVAVEVNGNRFEISSGGLWQVARGNSYSIDNNANIEAIIWFWQTSTPV